MVLKAIETVYQGYRFRSRLEARWAVFFDALGLRWEYEPEGFDLGEAGWYLPDFWLPDHEYWIEIKAETPTRDEHGKMGELVAVTRYPGCIFFGPIPLPNYWDESSDSGVKFGPGDDTIDGRWWTDFPYLWCVCESCGSTGLQFDGRSDRLDCKECQQCFYIRQGAPGIGVKPGVCNQHGVPGERLGCPRSGHGDKGYTADHSRLIAAYTAARSARFEYGENGR